MPLAYCVVAAQVDVITTCSTVRRHHQHHQLHSTVESNAKDKHESDDEFRFRRRIEYPGMVVRRHPVAIPPADDYDNLDDIDDDQDDVDRRPCKRDRPEIEDAWGMSTDDTARSYERRRYLHQSITDLGRSSIQTHDYEMLEQDGGNDDDDDYLDRTDDSDEKRSPSTMIANVTTAVHAHAPWPLPYVARPALTGMLTGNAGKLHAPYVQFPSIMAPPRESNVKLAAIDGTEVAVAQFAENNILPADMAALNVVLWNLHQQQMFQMHMLLQLQQQIVYSSATSPNVNTPCGSSCNTSDLPDNVTSVSAASTSCAGQPLVGAGLVLQSATDQMSLPSAAQRHQMLQHPIHQQPLSAIFTNHSIASSRPFAVNATARYNDVGSKPGAPERDEPLPQSSMPTSSSGYTASTQSVVHMSSAIGGLMSSTQQPLQLGQSTNSSLHPPSQSQQPLVADNSSSITTSGDYVTAPPSSGVGGLGAIPPMLAMIDMSLGRLEQQQKQSSEGIYTCFDINIL